MRTVFHVIAALSLLGGMPPGYAQAPPGQQPAKQEAPAAITPALTTFPNFGLSVAIPKGWERTADWDMGVLGDWIKVDAQTGKLRAEILISLRKIEEPTEQDIARKVLASIVGPAAEATAKSTKMSTLTLGDKPAPWFTVEKIKIPPTPFSQCQGIFSKRDDSCYCILLFAVKGEDLAPIRQSIAASWKVLPYEPPSTHLEPLSEPVSILGGQIRVRLPQSMRILVKTPAPGLPPDMLDTDLIATDERTSVLALIVEAQILPNSPKYSFRELRDRFGKEAEARMKIETPILWHASSGKLPGFLSDDLKTPLQLENNVVAVYRYGLTKLSAKRLVLWTITISNQDSESRKLYTEAADKILQSAVMGAASP